ncbi:MAG: DUF488 domain-containing protein [Bacilli bacterium]|nr:DUF488 domain-containing protein [bacterium]MDY2697693.1 DUF488 domain-containing protein [Bacilli bacterium]
MNTVFTIGYTSYKIERFIEILKKNNISCLIDVRSIPRSSRYKDFDDNNLTSLLKNYGIIYRNYKKEFGARQVNLEFYNKKGFLDFNVFSKSKQFNAGIDKIKKAQEMGHVVCLMCAEKDPINCHRAILITRYLDKEGFNIKHILANDEICDQKDIDRRLLDKYYPNRNQLSLFSENNLTDEESLDNAYKLRNEEIGFKIEGEE